jgi:adenosylcobinamide hydrolase
VVKFLRVGFKSVTDLVEEKAKAEAAFGNEFYVGEGVSLEHTPDHIHLEFETQRRVLSSAVLNGGFRQANHFLNMKVPKLCPIALEDPEKTLECYCRDRGWNEPAVGMMTAASMKSLRVVREALASESSVVESLAVIVTTGLDNARWAGDPADFSALASVPNKIGTINMAIVTSAQLTEAAMVEMITVATEAKVTALQTLEILSPVSGQLATGTGTDAIAIVSGEVGRERDRQPVRFVGKHTLMGERVAQMVIKALHSSINYSSKDHHLEPSC